MITIEIQASTAEVDALINLLNDKSAFENIKQQIISSRDLSEHRQDEEIPKEGDNEYIERSE